MITNWQMWFVLSAMLFLGYVCHVGVFLGQFALASLITGGVSATNLLWELESQLQLFLLLSLIFAGSTYLRGRRGRRENIRS
ncbi:MAG: hypothetical protein GX030_07525 [Firmicutes bacterium]|nr:hypothetical protein [Bacillota bacterium]